MLTAKQAKELQLAMQQQEAEATVFSILKDVAERAIDPKDRSYIYYDLAFIGTRANLVINKLKELGYVVESSQDKEYEETSLTVRW